MGISKFAARRTTCSPSRFVYVAWVVILCAGFGGLISARSQSAGPIDAEAYEIDMQTGAVILPVLPAEEFVSGDVGIALVPAGGGCVSLFRNEFGTVHRCPPAQTEPFACVASVGGSTYYNVVAQRVCVCSRSEGFAGLAWRFQSNLLDCAVE